LAQKRAARSRTYVLSSLRAKRSNPALASREESWIASRSLSSGARSRDPLVRNDGSCLTMKSDALSGRRHPRKRVIRYSRDISD
ncbi:MAG TPA: hypothetical protein VN065_13955, partial [Bradyrhizobium sp.]|nr:hypothetical protein [Bradyrhizobium sp.]